MSEKAEIVPNDRKVIYELPLPAPVSEVVDVIEMLTEIYGRNVWQVQSGEMLQFFVKSATKK